MLGMPGRNCVAWLKFLYCPVDLEYPVRWEENPALAGIQCGANVMYHLGWAQMRLFEIDLEAQIVEKVKYKLCVLECSVSGP